MKLALPSLRSIAPQGQHAAYIDGLRGIAILMVCANHICAWVIDAPSTRWWFPTLETWIKSGNRGVLLFFLVSAYTLFLSCEKRFPLEKHPLRNFYLRRVFRILPLWWVALFTYSGFRLSVLGDHPCCLFMYFGFHTKETHLFFPGWTLFVEETFYLFLPLLFPLMRTLKNCLVLLVGFILIRLGWLSLSETLFFSQKYVYANLFPLSHWYAFLVGISLFHVATKTNCVHLCFKAKVAPYAWDFLTAIAIFFLLFPHSDWGSGDAKATLALALFFFTSMSAKTFCGRVVRFRWLQRFGICCYSIYLFHPFFIGTLGFRLQLKLLRPLHLDTAHAEVRFLIMFTVISALLLIFGHFSFVWFESPCVSLGKKLIHWLEGMPTKQLRPQPKADRPVEAACPDRDLSFGGPHAPSPLPAPSDLRESQTNG